MRGHLTEKADIFSFGVVVMEIISGRPNTDSTLADDKMYLLEWVCALALTFLPMVETVFLHMNNHQTSPFLHIINLGVLTYSWIFF